MGSARLLALLALALCTFCTLGCGPRPPERNPAPALMSPVVVSVLLERDHAFADVARLAARRLNESRGPAERPVRIEIDPTSPSGRVAVPVTRDAPAHARTLVLVPRRGPLPDAHRADPALEGSLGSDDLRAAHALSVYDAVLVAGLASRALPDATPDGLLTWLRGQPGWELSLGPVDYRSSLNPALGPQAIVREPSR
ncbi:MAG: hypothetical protein KDA24_26230 [Deltaproteobacteria bacterium]|nr:hypothetical protein [Deltaproteobacteria bacterium]